MVEKPYLKEDGAARIDWLGRYYMALPEVAWGPGIGIKLEGPQMEADVVSDPKVFNRCFRYGFSDFGMPVSTPLLSRSSRRLRKSGYGLHLDIRTITCMQIAQA